MASFAAKLIGVVLRTTGTYRKRYSGGPEFLERIKATRAEPPQLPTAKMRAKLNVSEKKLKGRSVWRIAPRAHDPSAYMLYYHGGGYVYAAVDVHWKFYAHMAEKYGLSITAPLYPLAPESGVEETIAFAMDAYRQFLAEHDGPFVLGGDSAGGGLASVVAQQARDEGLRQASGLLLICPWLDGSISHPEQAATENRDSILTIGGARAAAQLYARDWPVADPRVSPIHGDWTGLPPILCYGGGDDILVTDARALKAKLPEIEHVEEAGLMHDWPIFFLPDSRRAQAQMADFVVRATQA